MFNLLISVLIVLLGSATCSSAEAALFSVSTIKVRQIAQSKSSSAIALLAIREKMNRPIATLVILNNLFNIVGSIVIGTTAASVFGANWLGLFSAVLTFLIIFFGEIIPKTLAGLRQILSPNKAQSCFVSHEYVAIVVQPLHKTERHRCAKRL